MNSYIKNKIKEVRESQELRKPPLYGKPYTTISIKYKYFEEFKIEIKKLGYSVDGIVPGRNGDDYESLLVIHWI